ncbi:hypothetical protein BX600DRAFT_285700 [Xylariales sp. PMI_506]|nr:hypothetical protein BX600DRAFT_285700 [Xylariales sp. PMI_506]
MRRLELMTSNLQVFFILCTLSDSKAVPRNESNAIYNSSGTFAPIDICTRKKKYNLSTPFKRAVQCQCHPGKREEESEEGFKKKKMTQTVMQYPPIPQRACCLLDVGKCSSSATRLARSSVSRWWISLRGSVFFTVDIGSSTR